MASLDKCPVCGLYTNNIGNCTHNISDPPSNRRITKKLSGKELKDFELLLLKRNRV